MVQFLLRQAAYEVMLILLIYGLIALFDPTAFLNPWRLAILIVVFVLVPSINAGVRYRRCKRARECEQTQS